MSHGNATVEGGFSVNQNLLATNQSDEALIAQRVVYQAVQDAGGVTDVDISSRMLYYAQQSYRRYKAEAARKRPRLE